MERSTWQCRKQSELQESSSGDSWFMSNSRAVKAWRHGVCRTESAKIVTIRWWKRQKPTACGWMTICFICSAYSLSVRSGTRTLRLMICSLGQRKWSRGSRQCECWEPRLFCIGGLLSGYASKMSTKDFLTFLCAFHISLNIILTQRLLFCIIMSDGLENMPLVITERKQ